MNARLLATLAAGLLSVAPAVAHDGAPPRPELAIGRSAAFDYDPPAPGSYRLPAIKPAADAEVLDHRGRRVSLAGLLAGKVTVMAFIYTRCADVCPLATVLLHEIRSITALDPTLSATVQLVTLSFDPENDTPEVMAMQAAGLEHLGEGAPWHFLTTDGLRALRPILDAYGQPLARNGGEYAHELRVFLVDPARRIRNIYSVGFLDPRMVVTDVRTLLGESARQAAVR